MILLFTVYEKSWGSESMMVILPSSAKGIGLDVSKMDCGRSLVYSEITAREGVWSLVEHHHYLAPIWSNNALVCYL